MQHLDPNGIVLDTVRFLARELAYKLPFNTTLKRDKVWSLLDSTFCRHQIKVSFEDTQALIPVFQMELTHYRISQIMKGCGGQDELVKTLMELANKPEA